LNRYLLLAGFRDNARAGSANRIVSFGRAANFAGASIAQGVPPEKIIAKGSGNLMPLGCETSEAGRRLNRRVEVWVRQ
jgi:phosphate transport system substrate-binding protein